MAGGRAGFPLAFPLGWCERVEPRVAFRMVTARGLRAELEVVQKGVSGLHTIGVSRRLNDF
jgi:hypothetical protein